MWFGTYASDAEEPAVSVSNVNHENDIRNFFRYVAGFYRATQCHIMDGRS